MHDLRRNFMSNGEQPLEIRMRAVGPWPMNTYVLVCPHTHNSVLIDPGADKDTLLSMLSYTHPVAILLTHSHADHIGELEDMVSVLKVPVLAHAGPYHNNTLLPVTRTLKDGDVIEVGKHLLRVYETPGHTPDMLSFAVEADKHVIVGDTIFEGGPGRTWSAEDFRTTMATLRDVVLKWDDDTVCYPGHGPAFRLGDQRAAIEAFLARDHGDFYGDAAWDS
jgi:hydroxyacylglutathione hydrolase